MNKQVIRYGYVLFSRPTESFEVTFELCYDSTAIRLQSEVWFLEPFFLNFLGLKKGVFLGKSALKHVYIDIFKLMEAL
jgi:hypothetical protein